MVCDFEDDVINDIYNMSPDYHTKEIHIAVFPLEQESIIMLFIDARDKRYRKFYKQLNKLPLEEQLSAINYIIFSYSENVYMDIKTLQYVMGHSDVGVTLNVYTHASYDCAAEQMAEIIDFKGLAAPEPQRKSG